MNPQISATTVREEWARYNALQALKSTYNRNVLKASPSMTPELLKPLKPEDDLPPLGDNFKAKLPVLPPPRGTPCVAIIGAGAAGLFTALLLDYLKQKVPGFNVEYDILESGAEVGGRLYTYKFTHSTPPGPHDYYDVGAMRFPDNPIMTRTFTLFEYLKMVKVPDPKKNPPTTGNLIPYIMGGVNEPWYFNDIRAMGTYKKVCADSSNDPFSMSDNPNQPISPDALQCAAKDSPEKVVGEAIKPWVDALVKDPANGWKVLMQIDKMSTTQFLANPPPPPAGTSSTTATAPYNYNTIEWLETMNGGTNWYDQAHSETVLEYLDFAYPTKPSDPVQWWCIEGGAQVLATTMLNKLAHPNAVQYNARVTAIDTSTPNAAQIKVGTSEWQGSYVGVFNSTTLGAMQQMDLRTTYLNYGKKQAMRSLGYGASAKIGMKFSEPWWITKFNITDAGLGHSDLPIRTTVYPSYNRFDDTSKPAVLLCSYEWQQDAQRISTLISSNPDPVQAMTDEKALKDLVLWDLALLHAYRTDEGGVSMTPEEVYSMISGMCMEFYAHDWYHDPNTFGAFAFFRPQQFSAMWPDIIQPSPSLVMIGEHASNHHAWVVGALESVVYGMYHWLQMQTFPFAKEAANEMAGWTDLTSNPFALIPPWGGNENEQEWRKLFSINDEEEFHLNLAKEAAQAKTR